jgi:hypothetical protein
VTRIGLSASGVLTIALMLSGTIVRIIAAKNAQARSSPSQTVSVVCRNEGHTNW